KLSICYAAEIYKVSATIIYYRIKGKLIKANSRNARLNLTAVEEEAILNYIKE
ncbi:hypothetical protein K458DRAFT_318322, partial [Lentithecium fluviatile CBS 122367]